MGQALAPRSGPAFTLVELLVVVAIIVVLLALLSPALDKAIYQAELAVCAARQFTVAQGAVTYALSHKRAYPYRRIIREPGPGPATDQEPLNLVNNGVDDRPILRQVISIRALNDPLAPAAVDLETTQSGWVQCSYEMWFGFGYTGNSAGPGMFRTGDRVTFTDPASGRTYRFNLLASDFDMTYLPNYNYAYSSHPDREGVLVSNVARDQESFTGTGGVPGGGVDPYVITYSYWNRLDMVRRGPLDLNYAFDDGAVIRLDDVQPLDGRLSRVPYRADQNGWPIVGLQLPEH